MVANGGEMVDQRTLGVRSLLLPMRGSVRPAYGLAIASAAGFLGAVSLFALACVALTAAEYDLENRTALLIRNIIIAALALGSSLLLIRLAKSHMPSRSSRGLVAAAAMVVVLFGYLVLYHYVLMPSAWKRLQAVAGYLECSRETDTLRDIYPWCD
jgi:hypothetical protein